ncbi:DUF2752 domain-containing protein [Paenibacillus sp. N5-1-1-5]|uniref:DUF2752 domain-containing protein n=2 Tax=Paenibacillus radicis (ex Xue et al. 2023) TaxID=2972489 RepID=A0ABT1YM32_9BACL|nr:DUF2752 domain-containing protein [Paenibacillus radicis (ex Xue et al. 2023)]
MSINWHKFGLNPKRNPKLVWGSSLGIGGLLYLKIWIPVTGIEIPCVFHELTGFYCPGCGMTRAVLSLLKLDFYQAFRYNPLLFLILPMYITYTIANKKQMPRISNVIMSVMLIVTLASGLLRNIPAFVWLAPTAIR